MGDGMDSSAEVAARLGATGYLADEELATVVFLASRMRDEHQLAVLQEQVAELRVHISKEEDGLFPVTLVEFSGPEWDAAIDAWHRAHPGQQLIQD